MSMKGEVMAKKPVPVLCKELEASQHLKEGKNDNSAPIAMLEIQPLGQEHISLGEYTNDRPPIGFSIEVTPSFEPDDVVAQITSLSAKFDEFELVLHIANYSDKAIVVEVHQLYCSNYKNKA